MAAPAEADWEAAKENFQPLKAGRKAGALKVRENTAELRSAANEEQRRAYWEELAGYSGDDPLGVWLRFIKWTQETFTAGGHKAELLPLLERCTRELQADGRYAGDVRYLRVWIQYADCLPDPGDVFAFLKENDIGQEHALYYIAFATYLEARGGYAKADSVYQQGINRLAAPVDRLRAKFADFQQRMARRIQRKAAEQSAGGEAAEPDHPERRSLGVLGGRNAGGRPPAGGARGSGLLLGGAGLLGKRKAAPAGGVDQENAAGAGLDIFVDEEFCAPAGGLAPASAPAALFQPGRSAAAPWTKLGGFEAGRKENVQRASVWAGQKIKQSAAHSAPAAPALEVFVDPELQELEEHQAGGGSDGAEASKPTLRQRLDGGGHGSALPEEEIIQNPLQLHKAQASGPALGGVPGRAAAAPEAKRRREEVMAFTEAALISGSGEELCFEEVRAALWQRQQLERGEGQAAEAEELPDMELDGDTCAIMLEADAAEGPAEEAAMPQAVAEAGQMHADEAAAAPSTAPADAAPAGLGSPALAAESPAPSGAFGSPVEVVGVPPAEQVVQEQQQEAQAAAAEQAGSPAAEAGNVAGAVAAAAAPASAAELVPARPTPFDQPMEPEAAGGCAYEPTMTISTRDAFAAINQMFGGALPAGAGPVELFGGVAAAPAEVAPGGAASSRGGAMAAAGLEPTMTIATKDAFAALNKMFKGSLPLEHSSLPPNPYAEPTINLARGGFGAEPTMTISTKAAFDAVNQMFKGALPHEHGVLPPTSRGPVGGGYEPTVTISTKAAFEALNQMFGGGAAGAVGPGAADTQQEQQQGGFRMPAPRPPRARPAAAAAAAQAPPESPDGFCIREDTQFVSVPLEALEADADLPGPTAAGAAADSPGNDFGGSGFCIREDTQFVTVAAGAVDAEEDEAGGTADSPGGGSFCIREDTQYITVAMQPDEEEAEDEEMAGEQQQEQQQQQQHGRLQARPAEPAGGAFMIREDTLFMGGGNGAVSSPAPLAAEAGSSGGGHGLAPAGPSAPAADGGFAIREDTQFMGLGPCGCSHPSSGFPSPSYSSDAGGSTGDLLGTQLCRPEGDGGSPAHSANAVQVNKWGFAPGADDTLALDLDMGDTQALLNAVDAAAAADPAAAAQLQAAAAGIDNMLAAESGGATEDLVLQMGMQGLQLADCKENLPVVAGGAGGSGRRLADPSVAAAALQPLSGARMEQLGAAMEADAAAEAALAAAAETEAEAQAAEGDAGLALAQQDSFMVWEDEQAEDEGSLPLMGSPAGSGNSLAALVEQQQPGAEAEAGFVTPLSAQPDALVDPFSPTFHDHMLSCLDPAVSEWPGVHCLNEEEEAAADAAFKAAGRSAAALEELQLCGLEFAVSGCIGEGSYAKVFQGVDGDCADVALKREAPPCPWEWYICKALAGRLPEGGARCRFINPTALLLGARSSVLVAPLGPHGSLQDLVNAYLARGQVPPECLAMHFAVELLRSMQLLHAARVVHTDIKPDNLLVLLGQQGAGDENAGPSLGLQMIDFGRSVDLELLPPGVALQGDSGTDAFRCVEMREGAPWVWQADSYGVAASVHTLLHGRYMDVERVRDSSTGVVSLRPVQPFKRQWAGDLWGAFFHRMLNHTDPLAPPAVDDLVRSFEAHLQNSREVSQRLRKELAAAAAMLPRRC